MNTRIISSYVHHEDQCFFVSTINCGSAKELYGHRYNETIVWNYNYNTKECGDMIHQDKAPTNSIKTHNEICELLFKSGVNALKHI